MRSHLEFSSAILSDTKLDSDDPSGERLAHLLVAELPKHGYEIKGVIPEDWGWCVQIANSRFPLWIGCGMGPDLPEGHLCFIEPSRPIVRRWLKRISTIEIVESLAHAVETIVRNVDDATALRWWTEAEVARG